eukprot:768746-Hanusia_phi.AAC.9
MQHDLQEEDEDEERERGIAGIMVHTSCVKGKKIVNMQTRVMASTSSCLYFSITILSEADLIEVVMITSQVPLCFTLIALHEALVQVCFSCQPRPLYPSMGYTVHLSRSPRLVITATSARAATDNLRTGGWNILQLKIIQTTERAALSIGEAEKQFLPRPKTKYSIAM